VPGPCLPLKMRQMRQIWLRCYEVSASGPESGLRGGFAVTASLWARMRS
jgi:hypothetical protein